jgi:hypothetical protein
VQEVVDASLEDLKSLGSSPGDPLLMLNPFGTNTTGVHAQFATEDDGTLTDTVSSPGADAETCSSRRRGTSPTPVDRAGWCATTTRRWRTASTT